jgi:hypothetical protein
VTGRSRSTRRSGFVLGEGSPSELTGVDAQLRPHGSSEANDRAGVGEPTVPTW